MGVLSGNVLYYGRWQEQGITREKVFLAADDELGVMAVARALNFGWADIRNTDQEVEKYTEYGISFRDYGRKAHYSQPVVVIANETMGYREISTGLQEVAFRETVVTYDDWDSEEQCGNTWTVDVYRLQPGMPDGWIVVQSSSSGAYIAAEKCGSAWTVTLVMPVVDDRSTGHNYEARFASAEAWYREQLKRR